MTHGPAGMGQGRCAVSARIVPGTIREGTGWDGGFMLSLLARLLLVVVLAVTMAGCAAVAGIFKAGVWVGIVIAVIVVVGLFALLGRG
jgi:amino acid transporter